MKDLNVASPAAPLQAIPLNAHSFADFGEVLENLGPARRRDFAGTFASTADARPSLWINRLQPMLDSSLSVDIMERHPHSPQTFVPLGDSRFLVALALANDDGTPDLSTLRAFVSAGGQGVTYRRNVWHYAFTSLDTVLQVAVIQSSSGRDDDTVIARLATPVAVEISLAATF